MPSPPAESDTLRIVLYSNTSTRLDRGGACLECRRRKMKCDAAKPVCGPCNRYGRPHDCVFSSPPGTSADGNMRRRSNSQEDMMSAQGSVLDFSDSEQDTCASDSMDMFGQQLLSLFFTHRYMFSCNISSAFFRPRLSRHNPNPAHPALVLAMKICGSTVSANGAIRDSDNSLYTGMEAALGVVPNSEAQRLDVIMAKALIAQYHLEKRRLDQGKFYALSAMTDAANAGLHSLLPAQVHDDTVMYNVHPEAFSEVEFRIEVFSTVYQVWKRAEVLAGNGGPVADQDITTPFPSAIPLAQLQSFDLQTAARYLEPIGHLFQEGLDNLNAEQDGPMTIRTKALCLYARCSRFQRMATVEGGSPPPSFWAEFDVLDLAINKFRDSLPPLSTASSLRTMSPYNTSPDDQECEANEMLYTLVLAHSLSALAALDNCRVVLHHVRANQTNIIYYVKSKADAAADVVSDTIAAVQTTGLFNPRKQDYMVGLSAISAVQYYENDVSSGAQFDQSYNGNLATLRGALGSLCSAYPSLSAFLGL